jgi:hypothetical protein
MMARAAMLAVAALALAAGSFLAFVRYQLRPRRARLDPAATGLPVEAVAIPSSSGARLAGWFLPGAGRGAVLLLHGAKSNRLVLVERMRFLRGAGYSTLAIDFQAHGESTGDPNECPHVFVERVLPPARAGAGFFEYTLVFIDEKKEPFLGMTGEMVVQVLGQHPWQQRGQFGRLLQLAVAVEFLKLTASSFEVDAFRLVDHPAADASQQAQARNVASGFANRLAENRCSAVLQPKL